MMFKKTLTLATLFVAAAAWGQSHSVANYSNPPNVQADSKAGTEATPGQSATADQQDAKHPAKGAKDAAANKGKSHKTASKGKAQRSATKAASKKGSQSASASVALDGASKGGAEAAMQAEPSAAQGSAVKGAFDSTSAKK